MDFLSLAKSRYTTKKYDSTKKIAEDKIEQLKEIIQLTPSSINSQPWNFIFVSDNELKKQLAAVSLFNQHKIEEASHIIVFNAIDDINLFEKQLNENGAEGSINYYNNIIKQKPESEIKKWMQHQVYLALGFTMAACAALDIDSTAMEGIDNDKYTEILKLDGYKTLFALAIGYRNHDDDNQPSITPKSRLPKDEVIKSI